MRGATSAIKSRLYDEHHKTVGPGNSAIVRSRLIAAPGVESERLPGRSVGPQTPRQDLARRPATPMSSLAPVRETSPRS